MGRGHFMGFGFGMPIILIVMLIFSVLAFIALISDSFKRKSSLEHDRILEILKKRYAKGEIGPDEYIKRKSILDEKDKITALDILKERYAKGEISTEEFKRMKKEIK